jgi:hypothetical protein
MKKLQPVRISDFLMIVTRPKNSSAEGLIQETVQRSSTFVQSLCHAMSFAKSCEFAYNYIPKNDTRSNLQDYDYLPFLNTTQPDATAYMQR